MLNVLIPMTGPNLFESGEFKYPKPVIELNGKTIFERNVGPFIGLDGVRIIPIISSRDVKQFNLDYVIKQVLIDTENRVFELDSDTQGALCTSLMAIDAIDSTDPLVIVNGDQVIDHDISTIVGYFDKQNADFGVVSFDSVHPKWSYVRVDQFGLISEAAEKRPLSRNAIAGFYFFKSGKEFIKAAMKAISKNASHEGAFFLSASLNELVLKGKKGCVYKIDNADYTNFYDPSILKQYEEKLLGVVDGNNLESLTKSYMRAFASKDLDALLHMFSQTATLTDPNEDLSGRDQIISFLSKLFSDVDIIVFDAKNIYIDGRTSIIHFALKLDGLLLEGVDVIEWFDQEIVSLTAYLNEVKV